MTVSDPVQSYTPQVDWCMLIAPMPLGGFQQNITIYHTTIQLLYNSTNSWYM